MKQFTTRTILWRSPHAAACLVGTLLLVQGQSAQGLTELGPGKLFLDTEAAVTYDTNIFTNNLGEEDWIFGFTPALVYVQDRGLIEMEASAGVDVQEFHNFKEQSSQDLFVDVALAGPNRADAPLAFSLGAGWRESTRASEELATRVESEQISLNGSVDYVFSEKTGLRLSGGWSEEDYDLDVYADSEDSNLRADVLWLYSEKLRFTGGYRYRQINYDGAGRIDQQTDTFIVGAEGVLTNKLTGMVEVGYMMQDNDLDDALYYGVALDWAYDQNTSFSLTGQRDSTASATGQNTISTILTLRANQRFTDTLDGYASVGYGQYERDGALGRDDDIFRLGLGAAVRLSEQGSLGASVQYEDRSSDSIVSEYDRILASVNLLWRF